MDTKRLNDLFLNEDPTVRVQAREMWESLGRPPMAALVAARVAIDFFPEHPQIHEPSRVDYDPSLSPLEIIDSLERYCDVLHAVASVESWDAFTDPFTDEITVNAWATYTMDSCFRRT